MNDHPDARSRTNVTVHCADGKQTDRYLCFQAPFVLKLLPREIHDSNAQALVHRVPPSFKSSIEQRLHTIQYDDQGKEPTSPGNNTLLVNSASAPLFDA